MLLSIGKENLYVWEKRPGILHEDEAAALLYKAAAGKNIHGTEPKEGKIELIADCDGLLKIDRAALLAVNRTPQMMIATIPVSYTHLILPLLFTLPLIQQLDDSVLHLFWGVAAREIFPDRKSVV